MAVKVSIIIPIYNTEAYLRECFDSLLNQTLKDIQVIMVDDGSTDCSGEICKEYQEKYKNFMYIRKENGGSASARNLGIEYADGEYLGFVDSDDWVETDMYETLYNTAIKNGGVDIVFARAFEDEYPGSWEYHQLRGGYYDRAAIEKEIFPYVLPAVTVRGNYRSIRWSNALRIYKKEVVDRNHIRFCEHSNIAEDLTFTMECTMIAQSYFYFDEISFYHQKYRADSITKKYHKDFWNKMSKLMEYFRSLIQKYEMNQFENYFPNAVFYFITTVLWNEAQVKNLISRNKKVQEVLCDSLCKEIMVKVDPKGMNKEYKEWYRLLNTKDSLAVIWFMWKTNFKKKRLSPILNKVLKNPVVMKMYCKVRRR